MQEYFSLQEVADILGFKVRTVRSWVEKRKIKYVKIVGSIRIPKEELERLKKGE